MRRDNGRGYLNLKLSRKKRGRSSMGESWVELVNRTVNEIHHSILHGFKLKTPDYIHKDPIEHSKEHKREPEDKPKTIDKDHSDK